MAPLGVKKRKAGGAHGASKSGCDGAAGKVPKRVSAREEVRPQATQPAAAVAKPGPPSNCEFRAPEAAEVLEIARTQNLYKSNLFRLQLEELLKELAPKRSHARLEEFLRGLKGILEGLVARTIPEDFAAEFPQLHFHQRQPFAFTFSPPKRIDVVGSFLLGTGSRAESSVDVAVEMPSDAFQSKDYLNFRYMDKRAAYAGELHRQLAGLCTAGGSSGSRSAPLAGVETLLGHLQGDAFRPCVCLRPTGKAEHGEVPWLVRLLPAHSPDLFPPAKLAPDRNLVRPASAGSAVPMPPTAHYNSCLLEDARMRAHLELLHRALQRIPALRDAILLLKRWAAARSFLPQPSGVAVFIPLSGFCLSILAAHAAQTSSVAPSQTSSFQLFKLTLSVLSSTEWATHKLTFGKATPTGLSTEEAKACGAHLYDADGVFNFLWRLGPFMDEIRWEAQRALRVLDAEADPYEAIFGLQTGSPALLWDLAVRTPALGPAALCPAEPRPREAAAVVGATAPADAPEAFWLATRLAAVLRAGLGDRCLRAVARLVGEQGGSGGGGIAVVVGLCLEATNLDRALDRGPSAESKEAEQFRALWGPEKAELRRFKDGSVLECAVWAKPPPGRLVESRRQPAVVTQIVRYLLGKHFPEVAPGTDIVAGPIGFLHNLGERERRLWVAFEAFRAHLCQLSSLPLAIKDVHPVDRSFSYTAMMPRSAPVAADGVSRTLHRVVAEFESSGRWPGDLEAARKVAGAMLLQMKEELQTDLGIEADVTEAFLDVRYPEFVFRLRIFHEHELLDTAHRVTNFQAPPGAALPGAEALERLRALWWQPRVRASLHAQVLQRPAFAGAARLCQRWLASQLLAGYEDFAEHLVASAFLQPSPFEAPTSPQVGLCRVCWLLDAYDWDREPLVVDFDGKLSAEERLSMRQSFERARTEAQGSQTFWICSRFDPHAILLACPPATVSAWLRRRAKQALSVCHGRLLGLGSAPGAAAPAGGWDALFALDTSVFDVLLRLRGAAEEAPLRRKGAKGERLRAAVVREAVESLVEKLRGHFSPVCLVFYDVDSRVIALKWRPSAFFPQHQNVLMGAVPHSLVAQEQGQPPLCVPNVLYITSAVATLSEGLAVDVTVLGVRARGG